ncbi:MAG: hypothetical protein A3B91_01140 [Candidatus Yanofskybacteria bacterium RIFCSPHIGHO2_02_FULL_41_29]|uniref:Carbohydrate kinase PfkB domain-containing protein n=1 Tax=Candidatus Yanofskybacteria bacterium RIFCSPHIGHO2_01_FULL_41_53 TaxID=1802663 RepID=A0A1F8EHA6_9BACT|nr:MAG: hypothetical protein A2650_01385 [Candidatus Yanofskybacteria bacterium RIFCSPHIGHO2_01_FULL_41_53]OGN11367.1 MAG: hypothetical protein A3B91_01140 [Candidatus Yanofskybacteria bacterium RIFCSPHIGHO2_02_FULL_41_29]OGN17737.1 MAG: hypothetical protein A3F48_00680 [Candidatus Yanofskybacteria bacterium RIFCSPHIGHO2_12_FULL_41_9]OGN24737.1 MAG: hypothetical protein A2916_01740 [Candidatus Yanofskybacteria bacterium RIFCSPLOWO2_01_FULL_41_67]OGN28934.1 MAG: hypothetical protein A3H54_02210 
MYDIISIGSATRDVFFSTNDLRRFKMDEFPTGEAICLGYGSKIEMKKIVLTSGGGGTNAAVTFARQGLKTANVGVIGQDFNGTEILRELESEGVDTRYFQKHDDDFTAYSVILVHADGERTIMSYKGEGQHFDPKRIPFSELESKWFFLDSLGGNFDVLEGLVSHAVKNNIKLATNPGGKELAHGLEKLRPLLKYFSIIIMNQEEAAGLTGIDYKKEEEIFKFMDEAIGGIFVMTKGPDGVAVSDGKNIYTAGVPDSPVVERTGAGDSFSSGFVVEYLKGQKAKGKEQKEEDIIKKAIQFATANASSVVTQYGAKAGILKNGDWGPWPLIEVKVRKA